jgi:Protein of unknown function (DUF3575)
MKKTLILFLLIVFTIPSLSQENANVSSEKNVLKINILSLFLGTGSIFYERKISNLTSAQMGVAYMNFKIMNTKFTGLILTPEFRIYVKKQAIDGFYVAPYLRYQNFTLDDNSAASKGSLTSMGGGFLLGRQWIKKSGFNMDLFFGGHYGSSSVKVDSGTDSFNTNFMSGFSPRVGFVIGFAF